jgi:hypothetical protein
MTTPMTRSTPIPEHTPATQQDLVRLRARYRQDRDLFTRQERARLAFVRWLSQTGRLLP